MLFDENGYKWLRKWWKRVKFCLTLGPDANFLEELDFLDIDSEIGLSELQRLR